MPTDAQLADIEARYQRDHEVDGICFVRWQRGGTYAYDTGADNALFTGYYLAAASFRYSCEPTPANLKRVRDALAGIELLTTVTGTPGVLVRLAFPLRDAWGRIGYDPANTDPGNTWTRRRLDGYLFESATHMYVTRTTRDQLVGVVFGLSAAWSVLEKDKTNEAEDMALLRIGRLARFLTERLEGTNWSLRDHTGKTHGTSAHRVLGPLRHALRLLDHRVNGTPLKGSLRRFYRWNWLHTFYYRWTRATFAWNLRLTTGLTLWLLGEQDARRWIKRCWGFVDKHNYWFWSIAQAVGLGNTHGQTRTNAETRLKILTARGYGGFFRWQKDWNDWGASDRTGPGVDVLAPVWLSRLTQKRINERAKGGSNVRRWSTSRSRRRTRL